jgi:hypothetical protein
MRRERLGQHLLGIFLVAFVLINFPLIGVWGGDESLFGFPTLFIGIFGVWTALIMLLFWMLRRHRQSNDY